MGLRRFAVVMAVASSMAFAGCAGTEVAPAEPTEGRIRLMEVVYRYDVNASIELDPPVYSFWSVSPIVNGTFYPYQNTIDSVQEGGRCILLRVLIVDQDTDGGTFWEELTCVAEDRNPWIVGPDGFPIKAIMLEDGSATGVKERSPILLYKGQEWIVESRGERFVVGGPTVEDPVSVRELVEYTGTVTWLYHGDVRWQIPGIHGRPPTDATIHAGPLGPGALAR